MRPRLASVTAPALTLAAITVLALDTAPGPAHESEQGAGGDQRSWVLSSVLEDPHSILYDPSQDAVYVSNIYGNPNERDGKGFITRLDPRGHLLEARWVEGLDAPRGMALHDGLLYVADINEVVAIDVAAGQVERRFLIPGSRMMSDVAVAADGAIYASDQQTGRIYRIAEGTFQTWLVDGRVAAPTALAITDVGLLVSSADDDGENGQLFAVSFERKIVEAPLRDTGRINVTGLSPDGSGGFLAVDANHGRLLRINAVGGAEVVGEIDPRAFSAALVPHLNQLVMIVPADNSVRAVAFGPAPEAKP